MDITITAQMRNGPLWKLKEQFGTAAKLADYLHVYPTVLGWWLNLKKIPNPDRWSPQTRQFREDQLAKYGILLEDCFPIPLRGKGFKKLHTSVTTSIPDDQLVSLQDCTHLTLPAPQDTNGDLRHALDQVLHELTPREEFVIRARFGLDDEPQTLQTIADRLGFTQERIRQVEAKALHKLRKSPSLFQTRYE